MRPQQICRLWDITRELTWLRRHLRALDLADLRRKRKPLEKSAYVARVRSVLKSQKAKTVAANIAKSLRKTCREVITKKGAASRG